MSTPGVSRDLLYGLVPAVYRIRDYEIGEPLRALLSVLEDEYAAVEASVRRSYDDWFVETCDPRLLPLIGDLVGVRGVTDPHGAIPTFRARVADALAYARRKGGAWVLARAARDVTGWPALAAESWRLLAVTQEVSAVRRGRGGTARISDPVDAEESPTPFDPFAHNADVRTAADGGRWGLSRVALSLWRLRSYPLTRAQPAPAPGVAGGFTFDPFGAASPLFVPPRTPAEWGSGEVRPWEVPAAFTPALLEEALPRTPGPGDPWREGDYPPLAILAGKDAASARWCPVVVADLPDWTPLAPPDAFAAGPPERAEPDADPSAGGGLTSLLFTKPAPRVAYVDPVRGRLFFRAPVPAWVRGDWSYGLSGNLGAGPYDRGAYAGGAAGAEALLWEAHVGERAPADAAVRFDTLAEALLAWESAHPREGVVHVHDSAAHAVGDRVVVRVAAGRTLRVAAAPGERPVVSGNLRVEVISESPPAEEGEVSALHLDGLAVDGTVYVSGNLRLAVSHCTLSPPASGDERDLRRAVVVRGGSPRASVEVSRSVTGPLAVDGDAASLALADSVVEGGVHAVMGAATDAEAGEAGPATMVERCTVFGTVTVARLTAADSIFADAVRVAHADAGGLTCCYVPPHSRTGRRERCRPDPAAGGAAAERPVFTSRRYGDPGFAQLAPECPASIRAGASDGSEMGAFHSLQNPRREANLRAAIDEFLPAGMDAVVTYVN